MVLGRTSIARLWFGSTRRSPTPGPTKPQAEVVSRFADEFRQYINNEIPTRLIDTSTMKFVTRDALFDVFHSEISEITDDAVHQRMNHDEGDSAPESRIYVSKYKATVREMIQEIVRYVVFSHRWSKAEPTYQDISSGATGKLQRKDAGFSKLSQLCETARALEYRFVWSDTCCIDKMNPTELGEAIHAMFKWYANSHLCIVHLAESSTDADFGHESWFTRGWTLQELLAPRRIKFYNKIWQPFTGSQIANDKDDVNLMSALSNITSIPRDAVVSDNSKGIKGRAIWEIMSWASKRKTTRIEDTAYSLLGLFDINIPIMYGEGEKAFPRLIEAIVAKYGRWDVFAWAGQASLNHSALPSSPACYPKFDEQMMVGDVGMNDFAITPSGLRLKSVPLIPVEISSVSKGLTGGSFRVTLKPYRGAESTYSDVVVECGSSRLRHIQESNDLHICLLNYQPIGRSGRGHRGKVKVGREYVCFLLHMKSRGADGSGWLKFATDNQLRISCEGAPLGQARPKHPSEDEEWAFELPLETTYIRAPRMTLMDF